MLPSQEDNANTITGSHQHTLHTLSSPSAKPSITAPASSSTSTTAPPHRPAAAEPIEIKVDPSRTLASPKAGSRRPPPSPATSPGNIGALAFTSLSVHHPASAYKRARKVRPIIDEYSSDVDHSQANSDVDYDGDASLQQLQQQQISHSSAAPLQSTPLRESQSVLPPSSLLHAVAMADPKSDASDMTIEGLMTGKSLRLDEPLARPQEPTATAAAATIAAAQTDGLPPSSKASVDPAQPGHTAVASRPSGAGQLKVIRPMKTQPMVVGETWYLIERSWYKRWSTAAAQEAADGDDGDAPTGVGPIDNRPLLEEDSTDQQGFLKTHINEGIDFEMLPEPGWTLLASWYGVDGPVFARKVVEGINPGQESVEFYPPRIRLIKMVAERYGVPILCAPILTISASQPLSDLKAQARQLLALGELEDASIRFWHLPEPEANEVETGTVDCLRSVDEGVEVIDAHEDNALLYRPHASLKELGLTEVELTLAVETKLQGRWLSDPAPAAAASSSTNKSIFAQTGGDFFANLQQGQQQKTAAPIPLSSSTMAPLGASGSSSLADGRVTRSATARDRATGRTRGLRGLNNLGNTCFMNSALQCLSNTFELQRYFVSGVYKDELNADNPLGMGGAIAEAFGNLIKQLWDGQGGSFWPREFKHALARFAPQFSGYAQHDSQELLAFLLDGLHEDLNRIIKKPYIEAPDWTGGGERELVAFAKKQWDIYKARNDSVIVDLFQGQYKSTLVCPDCEQVSIKFDPFMYLTLPIPNKKKWRCTVYFVPYNTAEKISSFEVQLPAGSNVGQLRQKVSSHFGVDTKKLVAGEVWSHRMFKWLQDYEPVIDIKSQDYIYFWELPSDLRSPKRTFKGYRYHSTLADAEKGLVIPREKAAILPVFTSLESGAGTSTSRAFTSRQNDNSAVGLPFFVAVPRKHVNDPERIQQIILEQYKRFSPIPDQLDGKAAPLSSASSATAQAGSSVMQDWELVDDGSSSSHHDTVVDAVVEPIQPSTSPGIVTEIREDGVAIEVPDQRADEAPVIVEMPSETMPAADSVPKLARLAPFKPIQSIKFTTVTEAGNPFPKGGNNDSTEHMAEELYERLARLGQQASINMPSAEDSDISAVDGMVTIPDGDEPAATAMPSPPKTPELGAKRATTSAAAAAESSLPLVYTSGALICTWGAAAFDRFLFSSDNGHHWGKYAEAVDEEIARESAASNGAAAAAAKPKMLSIEDCMDEFTREEKLGEDDPWYCPSCKDFRQATKKFDLWKAPDILVVHLKRFSAGRHSRDKLNVNIDFPLEGLDLSARVEGAKAAKRIQAAAALSGEELDQSMYGSGILQPENDNDDAVAVDAPIYDLYGVDNHFGGLGGGHYTAYAKSPADGKWYEFDDSSVRPVADPETVKSSSAYLLFYRRRTTRPIGGKSRQKFQKAVSEQAAASSAPSVELGESVGNGVDDTEGDSVVAGTFDGAEPQWPGPSFRLSSRDLEEPHPSGWLPSFHGTTGTTTRDLEDDDFDMFKPASPHAASSEEGAEPGSPRSTLSSVGSPEAD